MALLPTHRKPASAVLKDCTCLKSKKNFARPQEMLTTYCKVVKFLLFIYTADDVKAEEDAEMTRSSQPPNMNLMEYIQFSWLKALK